jgi:hypothetical protein
MPVRLSVSIEPAGYHWMDFHKFFTSDDFSKLCPENKVEKWYVRHN